MCSSCDQRYPVFTVRRYETFGIESHVCPISSIGDVRGHQGFVVVHPVCGRDEYHVATSGPFSDTDTRETVIDPTSSSSMDPTPMAATAGAVMVALGTIPSISLISIDSIVLSIFPYYDGHRTTPIVTDESYMFIRRYPYRGLPGTVSDGSSVLSLSGPSYRTCSPMQCCLSP